MVDGSWRRGPGGSEDNLVCLLDSRFCFSGFNGLNTLRIQGFAARYVCGEGKLIGNRPRYE